jgi:hypothetical protein
MKYIFQLVIFIVGHSVYAQTTMYTAGFVSEPFLRVSSEDAQSSWKATGVGYNLGIGWFVSPQLMRSITFSNTTINGEAGLNLGSSSSSTYTFKGQRMALNLENLRFLGSYEIDDRFVMYKTWGWTFQYFTTDQSSVNAADGSDQDLSGAYIDMGAKLGLGSMYKLNNHIFVFGELRGKLTFLSEILYGVEANVGLRYRPLIGLNKRSKGK